MSAEESPEWGTGVEVCWRDLKRKSFWKIALVAFWTSQASDDKKLSAAIANDDERLF
jgi:hypothetical protein